MSARFYLKRAGQRVEVSETEFRAHHPDTPAGPPAEPTLAELATNFAGAVGRWSEGGFATVNAETYATRSAVCDVCEYWDGAARLGLGKCKAPGCGCTSLKRWLVTEKCPLAKWDGSSVRA